MRAKRIKITYEINGRTAVANHSNKTVAQAVKVMTSALRSIDKEDGYETRSRITKVEAEY